MIRVVTGLVGGRLDKFTAAVAEIDKSFFERISFYVLALIVDRGENLRTLFSSAHVFLLEGVDGFGYGWEKG
jgi:hypothetical protein